jgi:Guanosine polyphosphate pyrophosphohydrolases/synthetases
MENIDRAYEISKKFYSGVKRYSGEEYIIHPLNVAIILADMGASENVIIAGLMCDILIKTNINIKDLEGLFSTEVLTILRGVSDFDISSDLENDNIILVKLAERLHNMRTLKHMDESKWRIKAIETVEMYMPVARKLGNDALTEEMNKLALEYL